MKDLSSFDECVLHVSKIKKLKSNCRLDITFWSDFSMYPFIVSFWNKKKSTWEVIGRFKTEEQAKELVKEIKNN